MTSYASPVAPERKKSPDATPRSSPPVRGSAAIDPEFPALEAQLVPDETYSVELFFDDDSDTPVSFTEVSGLGSRSDIQERRFVDKVSGVENILKDPGALHYGEITLKQGINDSAILYAWRRQVELGNVQQKTGTIAIFAEGAILGVGYHFEDAWPSRWVGPRQVSSNTVIPIEEFTLVADSVTRKTLKRAAKK